MNRLPEAVVNGLLNREMLRKLALPIIRDHWAEIEPELRKSPRIKDNGGPWNVRFYAGDFVNRLSVKVLAAIVGETFDWRDIATTLRSEPRIPTTQGSTHGLLWLSVDETADTDAAIANALFYAANNASTNTTVTATATNGATMQTSQQTSQPTSTQLNPAVADMLNVALSKVSLPDIETLIDAHANAEQVRVVLDEARSQLSFVRQRESELTQKITTQAQAIEELESRLRSTTAVKAPGDWNNYEVEMRPACDVFPLPSGADIRRAFSFSVPVFKWQARPSEVPEIDRHYVFRPKALMAMLKGMKQGQPIYAHGHTGTGKTTLAEQVCAHLNWPLLIVSLDSDVSRLDFIGRDALVQENGSSVTRFVEGVLPWAMQRPVFMLLDEIDFGRSDILYVLQRVLEGGKLVLTEDGGRIVTPHPMFRIMASGNTRGQGDDSGLYQGARVLSAALIGRFKRWIEVPYLEQDELYKLIDARVPGLDAEFVRKLTQYTLEHQRAFTERQVVTPISPRITMTLAENYRDYLTHMPEQLAREWAIEETVLNRVPDTDRATLKGVLDRIFN